MTRRRFEFHEREATFLFAWRAKTRELLYAFWKSGKCANYKAHKGPKRSSYFP
jgi:hypothetical protein